MFDWFSVILGEKQCSCEKILVNMERVLETKKKKWKNRRKTIFFTTPHLHFRKDVSTDADDGVVGKRGRDADRLESRPGVARRPEPNDAVLVDDLVNQLGGPAGLAKLGALAVAHVDEVDARASVTGQARLDRAQHGADDAGARLHAAEADVADVQRDDLSALSESDAKFTSTLPSEELETKSSCKDHLNVIQVFVRNLD